MSYTYASRKRVNDATPKKASAPQPSMDALRTGAAKPTQEQMGRRVDLPGAMRAKMENAFGADLSSVKLYESQAVADAGARAVTQGSKIAFAPGMLDFTSYGGQALLGHELSHVVSQARGEVSGGGFLNDHALEARADREGAMAARGEQVAMPTATLSSVTANAAAGPMQASKPTADEKADRLMAIHSGMSGGMVSEEDENWYRKMTEKGKFDPKLMDSLMAQRKSNQSAMLKARDQMDEDRTIEAPRVKGDLSMDAATYSGLLFDRREQTEFLRDRESYYSPEHANVQSAEALMQKMLQKSAGSKDKKERASAAKWSAANMPGESRERRFDGPEDPDYRMGELRRNVELKQELTPSETTDKMVAQKLAQVDMYKKYVEDHKKKKKK